MLRMGDRAWDYAVHQFMTSEVTELRIFGALSDESLVTSITIAEHSVISNGGDATIASLSTSTSSSY